MIGSFCLCWYDLDWVIDLQRNIHESGRGFKATLVLELPDTWVLGYHRQRWLAPWSYHRYRVADSDSTRLVDIYPLAFPGYLLLGTGIFIVANHLVQIVTFIRLMLRLFILLNYSFVSFSFFLFWFFFLVFLILLYNCWFTSHISHYPNQYQYHNVFIPILPEDQG